MSYNPYNYVPGQQNQQAAQVPVYHCQPIKNLQEAEDTKWFNSTPFVGLTEDGNYICVRRWDGSIPAATTVYFKRIEKSELPQPSQPVTHEEVVELIPEVLLKVLPEIFKQMGVTINANPGTSTISNEQLSTITGKSKGTMGAESGKTGGNK